MMLATGKDVRSSLGMRLTGESACLACRKPGCGSQLGTKQERPSRDAFPVGGPGAAGRAAFPAGDLGAAGRAAFSAQGSEIKVILDFKCEARVGCRRMSRHGGASL